MEQVSRVCARRCRTQTALEKLTKRRRWHRFTPLGERLKQLFSPTLGKAGVFRDDHVLPSTSHAVERGTRRDRKRHQSLYRVRTPAHLKARIALAMWRAATSEGRDQ